MQLFKTLLSAICIASCAPVALAARYSLRKTPTCPQICPNTSTNECQDLLSRLRFTKLKPDPDTVWTDRAVLRATYGDTYYEVEIYWKEHYVVVNTAGYEGSIMFSFDFGYAAHFRLKLGPHYSDCKFPIPNTVTAGEVWASDI